MVVHISRRRFVGAMALGTALLPFGASAAEDATKRGGLGMTGVEWKALWGEPDVEVTGKYWKFEYKRFGVVVRLMYLNDDEQTIAFDVVPAAPVERDRLVSNLEHFLPADATVINEYSRPAGPGTVVVYNSQWLAERFLALSDPVISDWFPGGSPGDFIAIYQENDAGLVKNIAVSLGNNP